MVVFTGLKIGYNLLLCCYATELGHSLPICVSNNDNGGLYSPFWTSSCFDMIMIFGPKVKGLEHLS